MVGVINIASRKILDNYLSQRALELDDERGCTKDWVRDAGEGAIVAAKEFAKNCRLDLMSTDLLGISCYVLFSPQVFLHRSPSQDALAPKTRTA